MKRRRPVPAPRRESRYTTRELSPETWRDFERLFARHGGVQGGCWCVYYHRPKPVPDRHLKGETRGDRNRRDKAALVRQDRAHGILVYAGRKPVGSCQYGPRDELPRIDAGRNYRRLRLPEPEGRLWRITCFFVDRDNRGRGVARVALQAALASIRRQGGGVVEAYPATSGRAVAAWFGTVGMFEREGFEKAAVLGPSNVVMHRSL